MSIKFKGYEVADFQLTSPKGFSGDENLQCDNENYIAVSSEYEQVSLSHIKLDYFNLCYSLQFEAFENQHTISAGVNIPKTEFEDISLVVTTDSNIEESLLSIAVEAVKAETFDMIAISNYLSETTIISSLQTGNNKIDDIESEEYQSFVNCLYAVLMNLCRKLIKQISKSKKLLECFVTGAESDDIAKKMVMEIVSSEKIKHSLQELKLEKKDIIRAIHFIDKDINDEMIDIILKSNHNSVQLNFENNSEEMNGILLTDEVKIIIHLDDGFEKSVGWSGY